MSHRCWIYVVADDWNRDRVVLGDGAERRRWCLRVGGLWLGVSGWSSWWPVTTPRHSRWYGLPGGLASIVGARLTAPADVFGLQGAVYHHTGVYQHTAVYQHTSVYHHTSGIDDGHPMMVRVTDSWVASVWWIHCAAVEVVSRLDGVVAHDMAWSSHRVSVICRAVTRLVRRRLPVAERQCRRSDLHPTTSHVGGRRVTWVVDLCRRRHCLSCCMHSTRDSPPMASYARNTLNVYSTVPLVTV